MKKHANTTPLHESVWEKLNEPIGYPSKEFAQGVIAIAILTIGLAWLGPHFPEAKIVAAEQNARFDRIIVLQNFEQELRGRRLVGQVAGASTTTPASQSETAVMVEMDTVPEWFSNLSGGVATFAEFYNLNIEAPFAQAGSEIFDISDRVSEIAEYYEPGVSAVWNAWLELMADPA